MNSILWPDGFHPGPPRGFARFPAGFPFIFLILSSIFPPALEGAVSFREEIAPILIRKCLGCHGPEKSKGHYQLNTFENLMKTGDSKEAPVIPAKPAESHLYQLLVAQDEDDRMPQKDDPLPSEQISRIKQWILEGARFDGDSPASPLSALVSSWPHPAPPEIYPMAVPILALAFSPGGQTLAAGGYHEILLWEPGSSQLIKRITNLPQRVHALAYHPSNEIIAAAGGTPGQSGAAGLYDTHTGTLLQPLADGPDTFLAIAFSPDGNTIALGGTDNSIHLFNLEGKKLFSIQQHADWVTDLRFNSDATHLVSASRDRSVRIYETKKGELETTYQEHGAPVFCAAFGLEGQVCSAGRDRKIHLWNVKDGKKSGEITGFEDEILKLMVAGETVISCTGDKRLYQHSLKDKKLIHAFGPQQDWIYSLDYHQGTERLATGNFNGEVQIWSLTNKVLLAHFTALPVKKLTLK